MSVQEAQHKIPSAEFFDWIVYLDDLEDPNKHTVDRRYLAAIRYEIARANQRIEHPGRLKQDDFLLRFTTEEATIKDKTKNSKAAWLHFAGIKLDAKGQPLPYVKRKVPDYVKNIKRTKNK